MFKKIIAACLVCIASLASLAQYRVVLVIDDLPSYHQKGSRLFLAGSFNNWNPGDEKYELKETGGRYTLNIAAPKGIYEYKITRGSWATGETDANGIGLSNRQLKLESDTMIHASVAGWSDHFPKKEPVSTATKNVRVIDTAFFMPQLNRKRRVWIYLPASYGTSGKKYPVLYMHDGQNLFDTRTSGFGEWGIDEAMDTLGPKYREMIVVGIDHGGTKRLSEYSPYDMEKYGKGEGGQYVEFLVKTLKPYIDSKYRTMKDEKHCYIAGSSMGGLISFYAILKYPKVFGGAGIFSPAFWIAPQMKSIDRSLAKKVKGKLYFYAGGQEGESMVPDMLNVFEQMQRYSKARMTSVIRSEGRHNEERWRVEFPLFYQWMINN